jgi:F-type H+-transporting ATPase subunit b
MIQFVFASEAAVEHAEKASGLGALGINPKAFLIQLISFAIVFLLLKKFAFKPITKLLVERRKVIDDGVRMGLKMEKEKEKLDEKVAAALKDARHEADQIIANAHKEAREVIRDAEKTAQSKANSMLAEAEVRLHEEASQARKHLEKELVGLVSEATEVIVGEKIDSKRDTELVKKAMKAQKA